MKKLIMILALVTVGFTVTSAFSDDSMFGHTKPSNPICSPPAC